jgi:hypothetical protein
MQLYHLDLDLSYLTMIWKCSTCMMLPIEYFISQSHWFLQMASLQYNSLLRNCLPPTGHIESKGSLDLQLLLYRLLLGGDVYAVSLDRHLLIYVVSSLSH